MNTSPRRVKKRLRKKLRIGEYAEYGFDICAVVLRDESGLLDDIIGMIESLDMQCGGGISDGTLNLFVIGRGRRSPTDLQRETFREWISADERVVDARVGMMVDAWH